MNLPRHLERRLREIAPGFPAVPLLAAVSGGGDSMAMLRALLMLRRRRTFSLGVVHFNHRLRGEDADADERFVAAVCREAGIPLSVGQWRERGGTATGRVPEDSARQARYAFFSRCLARCPESLILTAHTASDQAETMVMNLLRGTGLRGLKGIPGRRGRIVRPLLDVSRERLAAWADRHRVAYRDDATNADPAYTRNRIRRRVMPVLREAADDPRLDEHLAATAVTLAADLEVLDGLADETFRRLAEHRSGAVALPAVELASLAPGLLVRVLARAVTAAGVDRQPRRDTLATLAGIVCRRRPAEYHLGNGIRARLASGLFVIVFPVD
ncbi:MAG: tRNA lysidine(34) synthetase TilS [Deltaproteobacteria bacterium]|nr:tRNA lysidine(34) synthetase TilS [Candidatus Anaeroferrophillacea bacterium]